MTWLTTDPIFDGVLAAAFLLIPLTVAGMFVMRAPYGRFVEGGGLALDPRLGWFLMELPATLVFWPVFLAAPRHRATVPLLLSTLWGLHYLNRGFIFPALMRVPRGQRGTFGWLVVLSGWAVTSMHGYMNGRWYGELAPHLDGAWLSDPRFGLGLMTYVLGMVINIHSDHVLRRLRTREELERSDRVYRIPQGGLYRWVSSPSYLGELMAWAGFACMSWSPPGLFILGISAANLIPRAISTHRWYRERFDDYPRERRALIPFLL